MSAGISSELNVSDIQTFLKHNFMHVAERREWKKKRYYVFSSTPYFDTPKDQIMSKSAVCHFHVNDFFLESPLDDVKETLLYVNRRLQNDVELST